MATLYQLPCVFVVENNLWAIGMSHLRATGPSDVGEQEPFIYKKGPAFGMPGVLVDGMDVRAVRPPSARRADYLWHGLQMSITIFRNLKFHR